MTLGIKEAKIFHTCLRKVGSWRSMYWQGSVRDAGIKGMGGSGGRRLPLSQEHMGQVREGAGGVDGR